MADDVLIQPASSVSAVAVAADEIAGTKHQRAKVQYGNDGSATDVSTTNPLPVAQQGAVLSADGAANPSAPAVRAASELWNGAGWDRERGNQPEAVALASAARTGLVASPTLINHNGRGILLRILITTAGTGSLTLSVRTPSNYVLAAFTVTASGLFVMCPGVGSDTPGVVAANRSSIPLPRDFALYCLTPDSWIYELRYTIV